ncbi:54S ribosomal protein L8, mitochondrial [Cytospora mali]|uniref:Large ribosomal subunit protein bL17m n=1 Tax=Cytospora mali TaxID=578113 RepID=A0A194V6V0_CYTMA|nr:54S ribosomal protein L8, mitochondrial [Valsa mali var. pyri (nom. inval.)]
MAGGHMKYRTLGRGSAHRQALLRNLVTSLVKQEAIHTTWPKAKEAQRLADKLITLAKRNNETARRQAQGILFTPHQLLPKLFGELRERYLSRPGGYTRVLRTEPKDKDDQAPSAILELVDGQRDMRFAMTAAAVARDEALKQESSPITLMNVKKVTAFRKEGETEFRALVEEIKRREKNTFKASLNREKRREEGEYKFKIGGSTNTPWNWGRDKGERDTEFA